MHTHTKLTLPLTHTHAQCSIETQTHMTFTCLSASPLPLRVATGCGVGLLVHTHAHLAHRYTLPSCFVLVRTLAHTQCSHKNPRHSHTLQSTTATHAQETRRHCHVCTHTGLIWEAQPPAHTKPCRESTPTGPATLSCHQLPLGCLLLTPHSLCPLPPMAGGLGGGAMQTHGEQDMHMCPPCERS